MKINQILKPCLWGLICLFNFQNPAFGQILTVQGNPNATQLTTLLTGTGVAISGEMLTCPPNGAGSFSVSGSPNVLGLNSGVLLTTGCVSIAEGPNNSGSADCKHNAPGDGDLQTLASAQTEDACALEFDVVPKGNLVTFRYVFASEEYGDFFCRQFNDVFAFFVSGPKPGGGNYNKVNIALIPGTVNTPVTINNIGPTFCNLTGLDNSAFFVDNPVGSPITTMLQYDGFTMIFTATIQMVPCQSYHFKLAIADVADDQWDSGVFIEAGSFSSNSVTASATITKPLCPGGCDGSINLNPSGGQPPYTFSWSNGKTTEDISGLCAGSYTVTIHDALSCSTPATKTFVVPDGIDVTPPQITCPAPITVPNAPGVCGANVSFAPIATDNCTVNVGVVNNPPSGSLFPVGATLVTSTATDNSGNTSSCTFTVRVNDTEPPKITCPADITQSCELPTDATVTGVPTTQDNCQVGQVSSADVLTPGNCPGNFSISRKWTVRDIHGNTNACTQTIVVQDKTVPTVTCAPDVTVTCDTTPASTGMTTAIDNCDPQVAISRSDKWISGDCEWLCVVERTWTAVDDCGNVKKCIQMVTKNVLPLIEQALNTDVNGDGKPDTLVMGASQSTLTIPPGRGNCILGWLPNTGGEPTSMKFGKFVVGATCLPGTNPLDPSGHLVNPLLAQALKLNIIVRLQPDFGKKKLNTLNCNIDPLVLQFLAPNPDVNELLRVTNGLLGNVVQAAPVLMPAWLKALNCLSTQTNVCK